MNLRLRYAFIISFIAGVLWFFWTSGIFLSKPAAVRVRCETTKGPLEIEVIPDWSPLGAERFLQLVDDGFYTNLPIFRCLTGFICQFGSVPPRGRTQNYPPIADDPLRNNLRKFKPGYVSFAGYAPSSRSTHVFITLGAADSLGTNPWETPIGYVTEGSMTSTVSHFTSYGEIPPGGTGPDPKQIETEKGDEYLKGHFPNLDYFLSCSR